MKILKLNLLKILGITISYFKNFGKNPQEIFTEYWKKNHWNNNESKSGSGSTLLYTANIRREIPLLIDRLRVTSILDAPCGDFNWFKEVLFTERVSYIGADIVKDMIEDLSVTYLNHFDKKFIVLDVISDKLPSVDIWMCRDLIFHLPTNDIFKLINNFLSSDINYLLITSHADSEISNNNTFMGGFRLFNLMNKPLCLPDPDVKIKDFIEGYHERYLFLYKRESLQVWRNKTLEKKK